MKVDTGVRGRGNSVRKRKDTKQLSHEEAAKKKKAILTALTKASEDYLSSKGRDDVFDDEPDDYFTLSHDEMEALVNGDIKKIESWVSNMDRKHATHLLRWLIKERW
jgi:hypothetical protein